LSIIIWRIGGGGPSFLLPWGETILLAALDIGLWWLLSNTTKDRDTTSPISAMRT